MRIADITEVAITVELDTHDLALLAHACNHAANPMDTEPFSYHELETSAALFETLGLALQVRGSLHDAERERFTFANLRAGLVELRAWRNRHDNAAS